MAVTLIMVFWAFVVCLLVFGCVGLLYWLLLKIAEGFKH